MTKFEKSQIKSLLQDERFNSVLSLAKETIEKWQGMNIVGSSEYETLKLVFQREFQIYGLKYFLDELERQVLE